VKGGEEKKEKKRKSLHATPARGEKGKKGAYAMREKRKKEAPLYGRRKKRGDSDPEGSRGERKKRGGKRGGAGFSLRLNQKKKRNFGLPRGKGGKKTPSLALFASTRGGKRRALKKRGGGEKDRHDHFLLNEEKKEGAQQKRPKGKGKKRPCTCTQPGILVGGGGKKARSAQRDKREGKGGRGLSLGHFSRVVSTRYGEGKGKKTEWRMQRTWKWGRGKRSVSCD